MASPDHLSRGVVELAAGGDDAAFTSLVATHHADLLRVCYVILGDASLAEDAAQSAWLNAWRKLAQLKEPNKLRSWLVAVAANEARQLARRNRSAQHRRVIQRYGAEADPVLTDLAAALKNLSIDERRLLGLRYVLEMTSEVNGLRGGLQD